MTSRPPHVSIVMIFKDAAPYLAEAAGSALAQTWRHRELLLVDDGSTDGSGEVAQALASTHAGVRVLHHPGRVNRGMSASRALGIEHADGDLVAFLDGDDVWLPDHLAHEVALLHANPPARMVVGRALMWRSWSDPGAPDVPTPLPAAPGTVVRPPALLEAVLANGATRTPTCSLLVETGALRECGGPVTSFTGMYEDQVLLARLQVRFPAVVSGATSALYRQHAASATARDRQDRHRRPGAVDESALRFRAWLATDPELAEARRSPELAQLLTPPAGPPQRRPRPRLPGPAILPARARASLRQGAAATLPSRVRLATLARRTPGRGRELAEHYAREHVAAWRHDVRGRVLELGGLGTARHLVATLGHGAGRRVAEVVAADLDQLAGVPSAAFDTVLALSVLHRRPAPEEQVQALHRVLRPGGTLLLTEPALAAAAAGDAQWLATVEGVRATLSGPFAPPDVAVGSRGNLHVVTAALHGLGPEELGAGRLRVIEPEHPVLVTARALRPEDSSGG